MAVVGPGRLGLQLVRALSAAGQGNLALRGRRPATAAERADLPASVVRDTWDHPAISDASLWILAVPDHAVTEVARRLSSGRDMRQRVVLHTSGLLDASVLDPCRQAGAAVGSWHPLQTFPPLQDLQARWLDVPCAVEGDPGAVRVGSELAVELGMRPWSIDPALKPRYHAAAAVAANLPHILVAFAVREMSRCGLPESVSILPLVSASVESATRSPDLTLLTGAIARGDHATVERHLELLPEPIGTVYRVLAQAVRGKAGAAPDLD